METYKHDTFYYGGEILKTINSVLECKPVMKKDGRYVWCDSMGERVVYCDMDENDGRGCLEVHENGKFKASIDSNGILDFNSDEKDLIFNKNKIFKFLKPYTI